MQTILETFEYFCQISSKSIHIISSYTVSKLGPFFETQCNEVNNVIGCRLLSRQLALTRSNKVTRVHDFTRSVLLPKHYHYFRLSGTVGFLFLLLFYQFLFCICICISIVFCLSGEINIYYFILLLLLLYYVSATMSWRNKDYQKHFIIQHISYSAPK